MLAENKNFELDSRCPSSAYIPGIEAELAKMNNSLLQQGDCTWAFLGDGREGQNAKRYLFWTSFNTNKVGAGKQIPVLIQTGDGNTMFPKPRRVSEQIKRSRLCCDLKKSLRESVHRPV